MSVDEKLKEMGIELPTPPIPIGSYVPVVQTGNLCFVSGQIPIKDGRVFVCGSVPNICPIENAKEAAKICAINILGQLKAHLGSLDRIKRVVRINGFVQSDNGFHGQPDVLNAASDLFAEIFGEKGRHTRTSYGVLELPANATVELDAIVEVE